MSFHVGQKVVCVDARGASPGSNLKLHGIYTVAALPVSELTGNVGVSLVEIKPLDEWYIGFRASRFRPIIERKTDISIFQRMLIPSKVSA